MVGSMSTDSNAVAARLTEEMMLSAQTPQTLASGKDVLWKDCMAFPFYVTKIHLTLLLDVK